ncbi:MAG TPA: hypothetical protein VM054_07430 [bacterium]|nr:hypothetical protein [bacterium]
MSYGRRGGGLGAEPVYALGYYVAGGAWHASPDGHSIIISPDDQPGKTVTLVNITPAWGSVESLIKTYGEAGKARVVFGGFLLSDGRMLSNGGAGSLGANEFATTTGPDPSNLPSYVTDIYPAAPAAPAPAEPTPAPAPTPPWTGEQIATVHVTGQGIPENATLYGADGKTYKIAAGSDPAAATWLATYAPQGPALMVTGTWDPVAGLVTVQDAYIEATGSRGYGVTPTGELGPPSTEYPSTTPEGTGLMPTTPAGAPGAPGAPAPSTVGVPGRGALWILGGLAVALIASQRRGRP